MFWTSVTGASSVARKNGGAWDLSSNTVLHYRCNNNAASTIVTDVEGTDGTGSANTSALSVAGLVNEAFDFTAASTESIDCNQTLQTTFRSAFSIACWMKPDDGQPAGLEMMGGTISADSGDIMLLRHETSGKVLLNYTSNTNVALAETNAAVFADGATSFTHVVFTLDGSNIKIYINGAEVALDGTNDGDMTGVTMSEYTNAKNLLVGAYNNAAAGPAGWFDGVIDDFRIIDRVMTQDEIDGVYNSGAGTEYQSNVEAGTWTAYDATLSAQDASIKAYWKAEDTADAVGSNTLTNVGSTTFTAGKHNNAFTLNGSSQYLYRTAFSDSNFGTSDFTIAMWVNASSFATANTTLLTLDTNEIHFYFEGTAKKLTLLAAAPSVWDIYVLGTTVFNTSTWYHVACTRVGSAFTIYVNGSAEGTPGSNAGSFGDATDGVYLGGRYNGGSPDRLFNGQIDEPFIQLGFGASAEYISALYNSGTGSFRV